MSHERKTQEGKKLKLRVGRAKKEGHFVGCRLPGGGVPGLDRRWEKIGGKKDPPQVSKWKNVAAVGWRGKV